MGGLEKRPEENPEGKMKMKIKVRITDIEQGVVTVYNLSKFNWKGKWAAMRNGRVIMWIPGKAQPPFKMATSGRRWESFKEEN